MSRFGGKSPTLASFGDGARLVALCVLALAASLCLPAMSDALATTYYVDSAAGNDNNTGTSQSAP